MSAGSEIKIDSITCLTNCQGGYLDIILCRNVFMTLIDQFKKDSKHVQLNDCIRNTTALCNPRQNSVRDKKFSLRQNPIQEKIQEKYFCQKKILLEKKMSEKKLSQTLSQISSVQSELSLTNRCLSSLSGIYILQLN